MPRAVNIGSINIDHVYRVPRFVQPGETLAALQYTRFAGGKGFNQSIALVRAGAQVAHIGAIGADGVWLRDQLAAESVDVVALAVKGGATGHAVIQVTSEGENAILLSGGANQEITSAEGEAWVAACRNDDLLLLQNEISALPAILAAAQKRGLRVVFNPAPMSPAVCDYPLDAVSLFVVNTVEAAQLAGEGTPHAQIAALRSRFPKAHILLTLGSEGAMVTNESGFVHVPGFPIRTVDTTGAGDTFIGFFLAARLNGVGLEDSLRWACAAAACCCLRPGAADAIPTRAATDDFLSRYT